MKKLHLLMILIFSMTLLTACDDEGGGVIVVKDPEVYVPPVFQGPFGGPVVGDEVIPDPSPYLPPYSTFDLQDLINATPSGGTLELDRDANLLNFGLIIDKPISIISAPSLNRPVRIRATQISSLFNMNSNNLSLNNLVFELINTNEFALSEYDSLTNLPKYSGLNLTNSQVLLRGSSSFGVTLNGVLIDKSSIFGLSPSRRNNLAVAEFQGNNLTLTGNNFIDAYNSYTTAIGLREINGALIKQNVVRCFCDKFYGAISGTDLIDIDLESNILYDANKDKANLDFGNDPELVGSVAISFQMTTNLSDNGFTNSYNAQLFRLDDVDEGDSFNINLSPGNQVNEFAANQLFNYVPSEDFSPYCSIGVNPTISVTPKSTWNSYVRQNNTTLYYSGAIKPACL